MQQPFQPKGDVNKYRPSSRHEYALSFESGSDPLKDKAEDYMASGYDYRGPESSAQEIRVLRVQTGHHISDRTPLRCELKHISLGNAPVERFVAVSYCWGTSKKRARIVIDGQDATIPQTAAIAIRNLSKVSPHPLWIDAVCIDQENLPENAQQVAVMKEVYSKAVTVLIWLGPAQSSTADAIKSIEKIYAQCLETIGSLEYLNDHLYGTDASPGFKYSNAPLPDCDWPNLRTFYSAPWFCRLWVIQEIGLAKNATIYMGSFSIDAEKVVLAARWMVHRRYMRYFDGSDHLGIESASNMYRPAGRPLGNQLRRTHRAGCSKTQDRVYGLLGLLRVDTASAIVTSYDTRLVEVYARAIRLALYEAGDLSFLQFAVWYKSPKTRTTRARRLVNWLSCGCLLPQLPQDVHWPSWVLKLHGETSNDSGACYNVSVFDQSRIGASFGLQTRILEESLTLSLRGLTVDTVTLIGPVFTTDLLKDSRKLAAAIKWCVHHGRTKRMADDASYMRDLAVCLTCGSNRVNMDAELEQSHTQAFEVFLEECQQPSTTDGRKMPRFLHRLLPLGSRQDRPMYWHELWSKAMNRRFFATATGMIGMGPPATKTEDLICLLYGGEALFILGPLGPCFELVGDAYVRAKGMPCNGKTWSDATERSVPAENSREDDLMLGFAEAHHAARWFNII